jgi:maleate isomerase
MAYESGARTEPGGRGVMNRRGFLTALGLGSGGFLASVPVIATMPASSRSVWEPDGSGWRAQCGVLTPDNDTIPESACGTLAPDGVSMHAARVPLVDTLTYHNPPSPDNATEARARWPLHSIVFAFTTTSSLLGPKGEQALTARLEERANGIPVLRPTVAAAAAFRALAARRIALFHPPWFADDVVEKGAGFIAKGG